MMNQECQDGRKKTTMFYLCQNRYKDDGRKSVTPRVVRQKSQRIIIITRNEETFPVNCFHLQMTNFIITDTNPRIELCASMLAYLLMPVYRSLFDAYRYVQAHV